MNECYIFKNINAAVYDAAVYIVAVETVTHSNKCVNVKLVENEFDTFRIIRMSVVVGTAVFNGEIVFIAADAEFLLCSGKMVSFQATMIS